MQKIQYEDYLALLKPICVLDIFIHEAFFKEKLGSGAQLNELYRLKFLKKKNNIFKVNETIFKEVNETITSDEKKAYLQLYIDYYNNILSSHNFDNYFTSTKYSDCVINIIAIYITIANFEIATKYTLKYWRVLAVWGYREQLIDILNSILDGYYQIKSDLLKKLYQISLSVLLGSYSKADKEKIKNYTLSLSHLNSTDYDKLFYRYVMSRYPELVDDENRFEMINENDFNNVIFTKNINEETSSLGINILNYCLSKFEFNENSYSKYNSFISLMETNSIDKLPERFLLMYDYCRLLVLSSSNVKFEEIISRVTDFYFKLEETEWDPVLIGNVLILEINLLLKEKDINGAFNNFPALIHIEHLLGKRAIIRVNNIFIRSIKKAIDISEVELISVFDDTKHEYIEIDKELSTDYLSVIENTIKLIENADSTLNEINDIYLKHHMKWLIKNIAN